MRLSKFYSGKNRQEIILSGINTFNDGKDLAC